MVYLDWPLFVKLTNQCFNPDSDYVVQAAAAGHSQLGECLRTCFPTQPERNNDITLLLCHQKYGLACQSDLHHCFDDVVSDYIVEQKQQQKNVNEDEHMIHYPEDYANVLNTPGQCCNVTYVTITRDQVLNHGNTYAGSSERASDILKRCGFVKLEGLIDRNVALAASLAVNETLVNYTYFDEYYMATGEYDLDVDNDEDSGDGDENDDDDDDGFEEHNNEDDEFFFPREAMELSDNEEKLLVLDIGGNPLLLESNVEHTEFDISSKGRPTLGQLKLWHEEQIMELGKATDEGRVIANRDATQRNSRDLSNLRAGRFEMTVPPFRNEFDNLLRALRHNSIVVPVLQSIWKYPDMTRLKNRTKAEGGDGGQIDENREDDPGYHFLYANIMSQTIYGLNNAEGQTRHRDSDGCEDIKIQISIHDYRREDGGTYFQPGTHCQRPDIFNDFEDLFSAGINVDLEQHSPLHGIPPNVCTGFAPTSMNAGDVVMYYTGTAHGGSSNFSGRRRSFIDVVVHSSQDKGRPYWSSERDDRPYGTFDDNLVRLACAQAEMDKAKMTKQKNKGINVNDEEYGKQPMSAEWLCKVSQNVVKAVQHQRAVFHGYDETTYEVAGTAGRRHGSNSKFIRGVASNMHQEAASHLSESTDETVEL